MANDILIVPASAEIQFSGSSANNIRLQVDTDGDVVFQGDTTNILRLEDENSGSLLTVNNSSGNPIFQVFSDDTILAIADTEISGTLYIYDSGSTMVDVQGSVGQLFTVQDALSGSLLSVRDISGIPIFEVFSDDTVNIGTYGAEGLVVNGNRSDIRTYSLTTGSLGNVTTTQTVDLTNANYFTATSTGATTWTFSNATGGRAVGFVLEIVSGGAYTQTWPTSVDWPGGSAPTLTSAGVDVLTFITDDGGTIWRGVASMLDSK